MRLAIVGSTILWGNKEACDLICKVIEEMKPTRIVSGGAIGIDKMAQWIASEVFKLRTTIYYPRADSWDYYKERDLKIANGCDRLVRIASRRSRSYGSGWTRDRAVELGVPCVEYLLD